MRKLNMLMGTVGLVGLIFLTGCETMNTPASTSTPVHGNSGTTYSEYEYGVVHSIDRIQHSNTGSAIGIGTVAGAVVGGVLGNQVGSGRGKAIATVAGAAGGGYVGHQIENSQRQQIADAYEYTIYMHNGSYKTFTRSTTEGLRVGDRVRIYDGTLQHY